MHVARRCSFWSLFPETLREGAVPQHQWSCRVTVFKRELEGGALSSTLEKTDGGSRVREERLLTDGGGRVTVALKRREGSAALPSGDAREGSDTPGLREPKECERGRAEVLGTFSARAHRECKVQCGVCDSGRHALRAWRQLASAYRDVSQRPTHKKGHDTRQLLYTDTCTISCAVHIRTPAQPHVVTRHVSLRTARHVQAQRETRVTTQHLRSCLCQNKSTNLPDLPPWCATCVGASSLRKATGFRLS